MWDWTNFLWICGGRKKRKVLPESSNAFKQELSWIGKLSWAPTGIAQAQPKAWNPWLGAPSQCRHSLVPPPGVCVSAGMSFPRCVNPGCATLCCSRLPSGGISDGLGVPGNLTQPGSPMETPFPSLAWILEAPQHPGLKGAFGTVTFAPDPVLTLSSLTQTLLTQEKRCSITWLCSRQPQGQIPFFSSVSSLGIACQQLSS